MRWLVDVAYFLAGVLLLPIVLYRAIRTGKYRRDWAQRLGNMPTLPASKQRVWVHAVSVGEMNAVRGLIATWQEQSPEAEFVISTTTDTGQDRARQLFPELTVIRYPLDFSWCVQRALECIKPTLIVLVELEVWYQFVTIAGKRGIPVAVVNGRLSETSARRFGWIQPVVGQMFKGLAWVGAQDETYAERFRQMGVPAERVTVTRSLKWDTAQVVDEISGGERLAGAMGLDSSRPTWICGSTGPGEEKTILEAYDRLRQKHLMLQLAIVPRKPERFDEVADLIRQSDFDCVRRSESMDGTDQSPSDTCVHLGDTMGELRKFYTLADVVFVGRTLAKMGGSDMMEVAGLAQPIVVGPHTENFADTVKLLQSSQAISIVSADLDDPEVANKLAGAVGKLLDNPSIARQMAERGRQVVKDNRGATRRTLDSLTEIMQRAQHRSS